MFNLFAVLILLATLIGYCLVTAVVALIARYMSCPCFCNWKWNHCTFCEEEKDKDNETFT